MTIIRNIIFTNRSTTVKDVEARACMAALQKQVSRDFAPLWKIDVKLEFANGPVNPAWEQLVLLDNSDQADALGYHERTTSEVPIGYSFVKTSVANGSAWSSTTSHELLEMLADPWVDTVIQGVVNGKDAMIAYEVGDPVENDEYVINGFKMSNFVTPFWFLGDDPKPPAGTAFDVMRKTTAPFQMTKGGYLAYFVTMGQWQQVFSSHTPSWQKTLMKYTRRHRRVNNNYRRRRPMLKLA